VTVLNIGPNDAFKEIKTAEFGNFSLALVQRFKEMLHNDGLDIQIK
jgi:hypothetical protein